MNFNLDARYKIIVDSDVIIDDFEIGSGNDNDRDQILEILSGILIYNKYNALYIYIIIYI